MTTAEPRLIAHTSEPMRHPWPADVFVQGGSRGVVFSKDGAYRTAFVEAFPGTFIRGEGPTIADAEDACWTQFEHLNACPTAPAHGPFEARNYTNGAGFCTNCGGWFSRVLPEQPSDPNRKRSLMERVFTGEGEAVGEVFTAMAGIDELPVKEG